MNFITSHKLIESGTDYFYHNSTYAVCLKQHFLRNLIFCYQPIFSIFSASTPLSLPLLLPLLFSLIELSPLYATSGISSPWNMTFFHLIPRCRHLDLPFLALDDPFFHLFPTSPAPYVTLIRICRERCIFVSFCTIRFIVFFHFCFVLTIIVCVLCKCVFPIYYFCICVNIYIDIPPQAQLMWP